MTSPAGPLARLAEGCVVDASVAVKWVIAEEGSSEAARLLDGRPLHAPRLLGVEVGNALWVNARRGTIEEGEAADGLDVVLRVPFSWGEEEALLPGALRLARLLDHPIYDCLYLALALAVELPVATADRRFAKAAGRHPEAAPLVVPLLPDAP